MAARLGVALAAFWLLMCAGALGQQYQRLHVRSFTLSSDTSAPQLEQPFHVTLTIRVAENVSQLRNVFLPTFFGAEELGDVQQIVHGTGGTTYRETLTLVAHARGMLTVTSAYLDAIDARDGKAKRFISNSLRLPVGGGPISSVWGILRVLVLLAIYIVLIAAALFVLWAIFRRRRAVPAAPPAPMFAPEPPQTSPQPPRDEIGDALRALRERRDRASVIRLRAALWHAAGASSGETLSDVLARPVAHGENLRRLLMTVERATFIEQARLDDAIEEVLCNPQL
ncbi:MAG TPA: hypothetical protein VFH72_03465 [Candidatus Baltobacteraceae bacterium]|nr:hypothetical protein [Candidatus Baltobacteraceae bacterium]